MRSQEAGYLEDNVDGIRYARVGVYHHHPGCVHIHTYMKEAYPCTRSKPPVQYQMTLDE